MIIYVILYLYIYISYNFIYIYIYIILHLPPIGTGLGLVDDDLRWLARMLVSILTPLFPGAVREKPGDPGYLVNATSLPRRF